MSKSVRLLSPNQKAIINYANDLIALLEHIAKQKKQFDYVKLDILDELNEADGIIIAANKIRESIQLIKEDNLYNELEPMN